MRIVYTQTLFETFLELIFQCRKLEKKLQNKPKVESLYFPLISLLTNSVSKNEYLLKLLSSLLLSNIKSNTPICLLNLK